MYGYPVKLSGFFRLKAEGTPENLILSAEGARSVLSAESLRQKDGADKSLNLHMSVCQFPEPLSVTQAAIFILFF